MTHLNTLMNDDAEIVCTLPAETGLPETEIARIVPGGHGYFVCRPTVKGRWLNRACHGLEAAEYYALMIASEYRNWMLNHPDEDQAAHLQIHKQANHAPWCAGKNGGECGCIAGAV